MPETTMYDVAVIGGGVAGLAFAILTAGKGYKVALLEREQYPFHKVCGEFVSQESIPFLKRLGLDLCADRSLPQISKLLLSSPSGITIERKLDIGGTGISRYAMDNQLQLLARQHGVRVLDAHRVNEIVRDANDQYQLRMADGSLIHASACVGAYGKDPATDKILSRDYKSAKGDDFFIAVKHHIEVDYQRDRVEMHNFDGGYCGMSAIEDGKVNMSYICKASRLRAHGSVAALEQEVLSGNPLLKRYLNEARFLYKKPLAISHLYFGMKAPSANGILMLGDAAGNIAPLSGNGMSMALRSALLASEVVTEFLEKKISRDEMEKQYALQYRKVFSNRIMAANMIHRLFGKPVLTNMAFRFLKLFPFLVDVSGKQIHGNTF